MERTIAHTPSGTRLEVPLSCLALIAALSFYPVFPAVASTAPMASRNLSPLYANLGVPVLRSAETPRRGEWHASYRLHWASHSARETGYVAALELDGETQRHDLSLRAGITERLAVEVNLPFVRHSTGQLDGLIDKWHGFWGLPDGFRDDQPRNRLRYAYTGQPGFSFEDPASGPGDAELGMSWRLREGETAAFAIFAQAKFATGDRERFTGSGDTGYSAGLRATFATCFVTVLTCHAQLGVAEVGYLAFAPDADRRAAFASFALALSLSERLALKAQLDAHGVVYDARPLDGAGPPVWGALGLSWSFADGWTLDAGFSEDLAVGVGARHYLPVRSRAPLLSGRRQRCYTFDEHTGPARRTRAGQSGAG
jgi:hypothetical protein